MPLEGGEQLVALDSAPAQAHVDVPGLVVDSRADVVELAQIIGVQNLRDLFAAVLDAVAEPDRIDLAVLDRRPGVHRHGIGIIEERRAGLRHLGDVAAEIQDHRDVALPVEDAARADRIADTLVDAVFQRNPDVVRVSLQSADPYAADHIPRTLERPASVRRRGDPCRQPVRLDHTVDQPLDHGQVVLADVGQRELHVLELGNGHDVADQLLREADAPRADHADLESAHASPPRVTLHGPRPAPIVAARSRMGEFGSP